jgi:hypothetical protein
VTSQARAALVRAADSTQGSIERQLHVLAAFTSIGGDIVLVGGAAVNLHSGIYRATDIDVVGHVGPEEAEELALLGFERRGRHWVVTMPDGESLAVEVVASALFSGAAAQPESVDADGLEVKVIALDDLMVDRLLQATDGTRVTFDEAVLLAVGTYDHVDWTALVDRVPALSAASGLSAELIADTMESVRRTAANHRRR